MTYTTDQNGLNLKTNIQDNVGISYHERTNKVGEHNRFNKIGRGRRPSIYSLVHKNYIHVVYIFLYMCIINILSFIYDQYYGASMILEISTEPLKGYYAEYSNYQTSSEEPVLDDHTSLFVHSTSLFYTQCALKSHPVKFTFIFERSS